MTQLFFNSNFQPKIIQVLVWWKHWKLAVRVLKFTNDTQSAAPADWKTAVQMRALRHFWKNVKNNFFYSRQPNDTRRAFLDFNTFFSLFLVFEARLKLEIEPIVSRGDVELRLAQNKHQKAAPMFYVSRLWRCMLNFLMFSLALLPSSSALVVLWNFLISARVFFVSFNFVFCFLFSVATSTINPFSVAALKVRANKIFWIRKSGCHKLS